VPATFTRKASDLGIGFANYPTGCGANSDPPGPHVRFLRRPAPINNYNLAQRAINPVTYKGIRASALWDINSDWNALISQSYQSMDAEGVFYQMPNASDGAPLPNQSVTLFNQFIQQGQVRKYRLDDQWTISATSKRSIREHIWCAT